MNREHIMSVLYDLTMVIGSEVRVRPLLMKTLQRLLYHTSFPAGLVVLDLPSGSQEKVDMALVNVRLDAAVGDYELAELIGQSITLPAGLLQGEACLCEEPAALRELPCRHNRYGAFLRLPINGHGVIVLLAQHTPHTELPLTQIFRPVLANLVKAILLCQHNEVYTATLAEERDSARSALGVSEEKFRQLSAAAPDAIVMLDESGRIAYWNPAAERLFGHDGSRALGEDAAALLVPALHREEFGLALRQLTASDDVVGQRAETVGQRANGNTFPLEFSAASLRIDGGEHAVCILRDISERKQAEARIEFLAHHDPLTHLPNRLLLRDRFERAVARVERKHHRIALLFLDLDNFKEVNDSLGHEVGDELLRRLVGRLEGCIRDSDTISREGGDEFVVLLADVTEFNAIPRVAQEILDAVARPVDIGGHTLNTSVSIGIAVYPNDGSDFDTLRRNADTALYHAKDNGRNNYCFFSEQMNTDAQTRMALLGNLRTALDKNEFVLHYQPQIDLANNRIVGAEALVRWRNGHGELIQPGSFIPVAEQSGLIIPICAWVLTEACRQTAQWLAQGLPVRRMAVNLSALQFRRGNLLEQVTQTLASTGLPPDCLELELTESILLQDIETALRTFNALKKLGIKLSIDDFGTGYSSLAYLKRLAVDKLKIDRAFITDLGEDSDEAAIVRAIVQLGHTLQLEVLAEGVETETQLDFLKVCGCDQMQGYLFSRPLPAEEFAALVARQGFEPSPTRRGQGEGAGADLPDAGK